MNFAEAKVTRENGRLSVTFGGDTLAVDDATIEQRPALKSYEGRSVVLGIRPESMEDAGLESGAPEDRRLKATVELREDMGAEVFVHFGVDVPPVLTEDTKELAADAGIDVDELESADVQKSTFIARFDADSRADVGDNIEVYVDTRSLYFFDLATGASIYDTVPVAETANAASA